MREEGTRGLAPVVAVVRLEGPRVASEVNMAELQRVELSSFHLFSVTISQYGRLQTLSRRNQ